jgi:tetratricopeptide (TPR) repeat protein
MNKNKNLTIEKFFTLAGANLKQNKLKEAQILYNKILEVNPNHLNTLNNLGVIFQDLGDFQKAKSCCEKAIEIDPNYIDAYNNLGFIFKDLGDFQKAKSCYEKAIENDPLNKKCILSYGNLLLFLGDFLKGYEYIIKGEGVIRFTPTYYKII